MEDSRESRIQYAARLIFAAEDVGITLRLNSEGGVVVNGYPSDLNLYQREFQRHRDEIAWLLRDSMNRAETAITRVRELARTTSRMKKT